MGPVAASIERGGVHYIASDHLAELTLAILQKDRQRDASLGYARDVVPMLMKLWPLMQTRGVKFICNAGGLNPAGAAAALRAAFVAKGWKARIAVVSGDDVLPRLAALAPPHLFNAQPFEAVRDRMVFANAYLGARPIVSALQQGADIVVTGRVADAALFLAPLVHEFGWKLEDAATQPELDRLAQGLAVGHLLECSGQGSGGNFGSQGAWKAIPDLAHIGYPIAEVGEDGTALLTKAPGTGGRINFDTVRQQLLYEVHDPTRYVSPDVVLDLSAVHLEDLGQRPGAHDGRARPPAARAAQAGGRLSRRLQGRGHLGFQLARCVRQGAGGRRHGEGPAGRQAHAARRAFCRVSGAQLGARPAGAPARAAKRWPNSTRSGCAW